MSSETERKNSNNSKTEAAQTKTSEPELAVREETAAKEDALAASDKPAQAQQFEPDVPLEGRIFRKKYFVSVSKKNRIIGFLISLVCFAGVLYLNIVHTPRAEAGSSHIVEIKEPGVYLVMFKGPISDPYAWQIGGIQRSSLRVTIEPVEPRPGPVPVVQEHIPFKNLAGINYFSVAEFEIGEAGDYILTSKWLNPQNSGEGYIVLEQDPVEKFFARWFCGIIGGIAFLISVGFPVSARMAAATEASQDKT